MCKLFDTYLLENNDRNICSRMGQANTYKNKSRPFCAYHPPPLIFDSLLAQVCAYNLVLLLEVRRPVCHRWRHSNSAHLMMSTWKWKWSRNSETKMLKAFNFHILQMAILGDPFVTFAFSKPTASGKWKLSKARLNPVAVIRLQDGDLHTVGWDECPWALATPVKAIRVGVGL